MHGLAADGVQVAHGWLEGIRLTYGDILGTRAQLQYTYRTINIDQVRSGQFLGLRPAERKLLKRDGDEQSIRAGYVFELGDKESLLPVFHPDNHPYHIGRVTILSAVVTVTAVA